MTPTREQVREQLVAECESARQKWKAADFSRAPARYTEYLEACRILVEHDTPPAPEPTA